MLPRRVIVGSANLSDRAFSGKQAETLVVFDDDEGAWDHYLEEYEVVRQGATSELVLPDISRSEVALEDVPLLQQASNSPDGVTVFVNTEPVAATISTVVRKIERLGDQYNAIVKPAVKPKGGKLNLDQKVVGRIVQLVRSQRPREQAEEPRWLSIDRETGKVLLSGREIPLEVDPETLRADAASIVEYFENFRKGFHGDVAQHQRDFFMFMSWFYFSPFICELRNHAVVEHEFIFDFPMFAVLFGKSNCGKTSLVKTLMRSMFGEWEFVDKAQFTGGNLRGLLVTKKRFPVVFDDVDRDRFTRHGSDIIKDETLVLDEYPAFVLSMNAENHSFSTEIIKCCLMIYTSSSLPENALEARELHKSVTTIQDRITTSLYREYLKRTLGRLNGEGLPQDMLQFSSEVLVDVLAEAFEGPLPAWCSPMSIRDYQSKKYEKIQTDLRKMYETNRAIWEVRKGEIILRPPQPDLYSLRREIPDWILKPGSKAGSLVLDKEPLEKFLGISFKAPWRRLLKL